MKRSTETYYVKSTAGGRLYNSVGSRATKRIAFYVSVPIFSRVVLQEPVIPTPDSP